MTSITKAWIAAGVAVVFALGLIVWQVKARRSESVNLSAEDMAMIAEEQSPQFRTRLASDANARKDFADDLHKLLAVAEEARLKGIGNKPEVKRQLDIVRSVVIAENYFKSLGSAKLHQTFPIRRLKNSSSSRRIRQSLILSSAMRRQKTRNLPAVRSPTSK